MNAKNKIYRSLVTLLCALILSVLLAVGDKAARALAVATGADFGPVIIIDAGHGGFDPGAIRDGTAEKHINLNIAQRLCAIFRLNGYTCVMTRTDDSDTADAGLETISARKSSDLRNRAALAAKYSDAVFISIHQNAYSDSSQDGAQIFFGTQNPNSEQLAEFCLNSINQMTQPDNRRRVKKGSDNIYLLVNLNCPTILVECGFMSNASELKLLLNDEYCNKLAFAIFSGYCDFERAGQSKED